VFAWVGDPVASKFVASLARPGGTVTGVTQLARDVAPKQIELLKALVPGLARMANLYDPKYAGGGLNETYIEEASRAGVELVRVTASSPGEFEQAFAAATRERATAMLIPRCLSMPTIARALRNLRSNSGCPAPGKCGNLQPRAG
jgi:putative ABC transport system substrate-binding protein